MRLPDLTVCAVGLAVCLAVLLAGRPAVAQEFRFNAEPAAAFWVDEPQSTRFTPGFYLALRPGIALGRFVALQWSYALLLTPAKESSNDDGMAHFILAGVRVRPLASLRPESEQLGGLFMDFNLGYVRTGDLDRFGFDAGLGYGFQVAPWLSLGPVVRYGQIVQANDALNEDPNDAQFITVGLDFAFGPAHEEKKEAEKVECPTAPECPPERMAVASLCPDSDRDGVCDANDRCPDQPGPPATLGCPVVLRSDAPLVVLVQFEWDSAELPPPEDDAITMYPVLNAVAEAIAQDPSIRVCVVGYASEEGSVEHNEDLSRRRAQAVQGYLTDRGLPEARIPVAGLGARCQLVPESTRVLNRRVEFRRLEEGQSCPVDCK